VGYFLFSKKMKEERFNNPETGEKFMFTAYPKLNQVKLICTDRQGNRDEMTLQGESIIKLKSVVDFFIKNK
jgi:hypothetical protein